MEDSRTSVSPFRNILGNINNLLDQLKDGLEQEKKLLGKRESSKTAKAKAKAASSGGPVGGREGEAKPIDPLATAVTSPPIIGSSSSSSSGSNSRAHDTNIDTTSKKDRVDDEVGPIVTSGRRKLGSRTVSKLSSTSSASGRRESLQVGWWWSTGWGHAEDKTRQQTQRTEEDHPHLHGTMTPKFIPLSDDRLIIQFETPANAPATASPSNDNSSTSTSVKVNDDGSKMKDNIKVDNDPKTSDDSKAHEGTAAIATTTDHRENLSTYEVTLKVEAGYKIEILGCNCRAYNDAAVYGIKDNYGAEPQRDCQHTLTTKSMFQRLTTLLQEDSLLAAAASAARSETQTVETVVAGAIHAAKAAKVAKRRRRRKAAAAAFAAAGVSDVSAAFAPIATKAPIATTPAISSTSTATTSATTRSMQPQQPESPKEVRRKMLEMVEAIEAVRLKAVQRYTYRKSRELPELISSVKSIEKSDIIRVEWPSSSSSSSLPPPSSASSVVRGEGGGRAGEGTSPGSHRAYNVTVHWTTPGLTGEILQCSCPSAMAGQKSFCEHMALARAWYPNLRFHQRSKGLIVPPSDGTGITNTTTTTATSAADNEADDDDVDDDDDLDSTSGESTASGPYRSFGLAGSRRSWLPSATASAATVVVATEAASTATTGLAVHAAQAKIGPATTVTATTGTSTTTTGTTGSTSLSAPRVESPPARRRYSSAQLLAAFQTKPKSDAASSHSDVPPSDLSRAETATTTAAIPPPPSESTATTVTTTATNTEVEPSPTGSTPSTTTGPEGSTPILLLPPPALTAAQDPLTLAHERKVRMLQFLLQTVGGRLETVDWHRVSDDDQERHAQEIWKSIQNLPMLLEE
ncbi:hypothetical protein DFQ27_009096 [Actinomortierella ambigua]|uniref:SWIM-type domain-containing protein n=1 Tax=Actinomortierella ambigua TaxID=1343610 RepID=A0A9P6UA42_9FUNG|nr:hypothetical protein DFQ27_009096 [Actinomortierella ambigua]